MYMSFLREYGLEYPWEALGTDERELLTPHPPLLRCNNIARSFQGISCLALEDTLALESEFDMPQGGLGHIREMIFMISRVHGWPCVAYGYSWSY